METQAAHAEREKQLEAEHMSSMAKVQSTLEHALREFRASEKNATARCTALDSEVRNLKSALAAATERVTTANNKLAVAEQRWVDERKAMTATQRRERALSVEHEHAASEEQSRLRALLQNEQAKVAISVMKTDMEDALNEQRERLEAIAAGERAEFEMTLRSQKEDWELRLTNSEEATRKWKLASENTNTEMEKIHSAHVEELNDMRKHAAAEVAALRAAVEEAKAEKSKHMAETELARSELEEANAAKIRDAESRLAAEKDRYSSVVEAMKKAGEANTRLEAMLAEERAKVKSLVPRSSMEAALAAQRLDYEEKNLADANRVRLQQSREREAAQKRVQEAQLAVESLEKTVTDLRQKLKQSKKQLQKLRKTQVPAAETPGRSVRSSPDTKLVTAEGVEGGGLWRGLSVAMVVLGVAVALLLRWWYVSNDCNMHCVGLQTFPTL